MYRASATQGSGTGQGMATGIMNGNGGLCGPDNQAAPSPQDAQNLYNSDAYNDLHSQMFENGKNLLEPSTPGLVPGAPANMPNPLDPRAPSNTLPGLLPHASAPSNPQTYRPQPTQGNSAAQSAGIQAIAKGLCA